MTNDFFGEALKLPRGRLSVEHLAKDLVEHRNVIAVVSRDVAIDGLWAALRADLWRCGLDVCDVHLEGFSHPAPCAVLADAVGLRVEGQPTCQHLAESLATTGNMPEVIWLGGLAELPTAASLRWFEFLQAWAESAGESGALGQYRPLFCTVVNSPELVCQLPPSDLRLSVRWLVSIVSPIDVSLLCRLNENSEEDQATEAWREALLPSLAGTDLELAEWLWPLTAEPEEKVIEELRRFRCRRRWSDAALAEAAKAPAGAWSGRFVELCPTVRALWIDGLVQVSRERGLELSSAVLASLDRLDELRHRFWRAETALVMPLVNELRLRVCAHLTETYGPGWPSRWIRPEGENDLLAVAGNPSKSQLGHIEVLLERCRALARERSWLPMVRHARDVRNTLAHYETITLADYQQTLAFLCEAGTMS